MKILYKATDALGLKLNRSQLVTVHPLCLLCWFPSSSSHRHTQVRVSQKSRHFGRDAEIQAMDGNQSDGLVFDSDDLPARS